MQEPKLTDWISQADEMSEALREKLENRECKDIPEIESFFRSCVQQIASQRYREGVAEGLLKATEVMSKYALQTKSTEALDLIEKAQQEVLSSISNPKLTQ